MMFRKLLTAICLLASVVSYSQNVGINADNTTPDPSAMLDVKSTSKGMLIPRMSMSERDLIPSPQTGLMIYQNNNTPGFYYNSGTPGAPDWRTVGASASGSSPFIPRFTGTSALGNSNIIDSSVGLYYNKLPTAANNYIKIWLKMKPAPYSNYCLIEGSGGAGNTFLGLTDSTLSSKGILLGKNLSTNTDSVAMINFLNFSNTLTLGKGYTGAPFFFNINLSSGLMGYSNDPAYDFLHGARFTINAANDTAGYFTSTSNNYLSNGILRAEYKGTNLNDHVAIYGKSVPDHTDYYGIGVKGEGGFFGVEGRGVNTGTHSAYGVFGQGLSNWTAYGVRGEATSNGIAGGTKYGVYGVASGGATNWAGYFAGHTKVTGKLTVETANDTAGYFTSSSSNTLANGIIRAEYAGTFPADHVAVYGKSIPFPSFNFGVGVLGEAGYIGLQGYAHQSGSFSSFGVTGKGGSNGGTAYGVFGEAITTGVVGGIKYGIYGTASGGATNWAGYFAGNVNITGSISKGSGTFKIDHPQDPENKYLYHSFVESPDMMNIYNGNIVTDANGFATVTMPGYFDALNKDFRYQLTTIGSLARVCVKDKISGNTFRIQTSEPNVEVSWQVTGIRQDKFANAHRVVAEVDKAAEDKGKYIHPLEWNQPETKGIDYMNNHPELQKPKTETKWVPQPVPAEEPMPAKTQR